MEFLQGGNFARWEFCRVGILQGVNFVRWKFCRVGILQGGNFARWEFYKVGIFEGNYVEGLGIIAAILLATTVAFLNEYKANQKFEILNQVNDEIPITVIRDNNITTISKKDLVVGDLVFIETGDEIPADGQVIEAVSLQVNEASLTGESIPQMKWLETQE